MSDARGISIWDGHLAGHPAFEVELLGGQAV
jgi:hypothetical protein